MRCIPCILCFLNLSFWLLQDGRLVECEYDPGSVASLAKCPAMPKSAQIASCLAAKGSEDGTLGRI